MTVGAYLQGVTFAFFDALTDVLVLRLDNQVPSFVKPLGIQLLPLNKEYCRNIVTQTPVKCVKECSTFFERIGIGGFIEKVSCGIKCDVQTFTDVRCFSTAIPPAAAYGLHYPSATPIPPATKNQQSPVKYSDT